jgi:MFS family permease
MGIKRRSQNEDDEERPRRAKDKVDDLEEVDDLDEVDEGVDDETYEEALRELNRKKALRLKRYTALSDGLKYFEMQIRWLLVGVGVMVLSFILIFVCTLVASYFAYLFFVPLLILLALLIVLPLLMILAALKCKAGPPKNDRRGMLTGIIVVSICAYVGTFTSIMTGVFAPNLGQYLGYSFPCCIWLGHVLESVYLRGLARMLKDKPQAQAARSVFLQLFFVELAGNFVVSIAGYFLVFMGTLGYFLLAFLALVYILLVIKILVEMIGILRSLRDLIARAMKAEHTVDW